MITNKVQHQNFKGKIQNRSKAKTTSKILEVGTKATEEGTSTADQSHRRVLIIVIGKSKIMPIKQFHIEQGQNNCAIS